MPSTRPCCCGLRGCRRCRFQLHCGPCEAAGRDTPQKRAAREDRTPRHDRREARRA